MSSPAPIAVSTGFTWTSALVALLNVLIGGLFVAIVRQIPVMKKLANEREAAKEAGKRSDMDDMRDRMAILESKVDAANKAAHDAEMKLVYAVNAFQLLAARIRADNPDDASLKQATEMLAAATSGGLVSWGNKMADALSKMKGTGE